jgi:DNA-binding MarR family transcriptional regulator
MVVYAIIPAMRAGEGDEQLETVLRECLATKIRLLNRAVTAIYDEALRPHGLKVSQMCVLVVVASLGSASPGAVGRRLRLEKSTLSRNVDRMRARGWLEVVPTGDGRATELRVTPRGRRLLRDAHPAWSRAQERAAELLGEPGVRGISRTVTLLGRRSRANA